MCVDLTVPEGDTKQKVVGNVMDGTPLDRSLRTEHAHVIRGDGVCNRDVPANAMRRYHPLENQNIVLEGVNKYWCVGVKIHCVHHYHQRDG